LFSRAAVVALASAALLSLSGCSEKEGSANTMAESPRLETATRSTTELSVSTAPTITIENDEPVGGPVGIQVPGGEKVALSVLSDAHGTVSVGDFVSFSTAPGSVVTMTFVADHTGTFPIELDSGQGSTRIGTLIVHE
jgi:hypothetical protein